MILRASATFLLLFSALSFSFRCLDTPPSTVLPVVEDCQDLIHVMGHIAVTQPYENLPKLYGRRQESTPYTGNLPRFWQIPPQHRINTCEIVLNSTDENPWAEESLRLLDVVVGAQIVLDQCLRKKGRPGVEFPGARHILRVSLERAQPRLGSAESRNVEAQSIVVDKSTKLVAFDPLPLAPVEVLRT